MVLRGRNLFWRYELANTRQAAKRARQAVKRRAHNMALRSRMRTEIKRVRNAIAEGNAENAAASYKLAVPVIDTMVNKGILHRNTAARHKQRLNGHIKALKS